MKAVQASKVNGKVVFLVIAIISIGLGIMMSLMLSEFFEPYAPIETSDVLYIRITMPLVIALVVVLMIVAFGLLYSSQKVTTLY